MPFVSRTFTTTAAEAVQFALLDTMTLNAPSVKGLTLMEAVVWPLFQRYVSPPLAFSAVLWPAQMLRLPLMRAVGFGLTVTVKATGAPTQVFKEGVMVSWAV